MNIATFRAFGSRNYRLFFIGQCTSLIGTWMQKTAVSWVVYSLSHSKFMLGVSLFSSMFPSFLFSFVGGAVADRYDRYRVMLLTQFFSLLQALALALLVVSGHYTVWSILSLSVVLGIINAFDVPARQSLVFEMVDNKSDLPNALALNSSMVNLSRLIGPAIAGFVIESWGEATCFGLNALSFIAVIASLLMMRLPAYVPKTRKQNVLTEIKEGLAYVRRTPSISFILLMLGLMSLLVLPYNTLIPVYARDIFHGTAATFGVIDSAIGLGAFSGAIFLASLKPGSNLRRILAINAFVFGTGLMLFSHTSIYALALVFAMIGAFGMMSQITITNTLIQTTALPSMRGRVISLYAMAFFGMQPLGGLIIGSVSQKFGVENTLMAQGFVAIMISGLHFWFLRRLNKKRRSTTSDTNPIAP